MLAHILALAVGLGSIAIYMVAFFFPEIHRKNDFIWSGVGFFYALVLWIFAHQITGGLFLGHVASVALLGWLGWQTFSLRRQLTPQLQQTPVPSPQQVQGAKVSLLERVYRWQKSLGNIFSGAKNKAQQTFTKKTPQGAITKAPEPQSEEPSAGEIIDGLTALAEPPITETAQTSTPSVPVVEVTPPEITTEPATSESSSPDDTPVETPTDDNQENIDVSEQPTRIITNTDTKLQKN